MMSDSDSEEANTPPATTPEHEPVEKRDTFSLETALADISKAEGLEGKLQATIDFMERALAQLGAPQFKSFWELRKTALELFKDNINPIVRAQLWSRYTELTKEARRLKEILDEQSAFAVEQIEIAIKALEDELAAFAERLANAQDVNFGARSVSLEPRQDYYSATQKELALLNAEASRINALRKELIKTEMRVRQKNKFFQRLSAAGDHVFPRRKDLIKDLSENFIADIEGFISRNFGAEDIGESLFFLREEIKSLQTIAKVLTLNTRSFTHTRTRLSEGWDKVKQSEKDRKRERVKKKAVFKQNAEAIEEKISTISKQLSEGAMSFDEANTELEAINVEMRSVELGRDELQELRGKLQEAFKPIRDKIKEAESERRREEQERERSRRAKVTSLQARVETLISDNAELTLEQVEAERDAIIAGATDNEVSKIERLDIEKRLKPVRDVLADKKAQALMHLSKDDQEALSQLREVLKEKNALRQEIKAQLQQFRKTLGGSGLGFEQAMKVNDQQKLEKERLEKAEQSIAEIVQKIAELEASS